ncbi:glutathione S-transferase family protein [Advenella kashmirensis]
MLKLYFSPGGACSTAAHIGLEESGLPYEEKPTLIANGEHRTEAYLRINPRGKVPALIVDGRVLVENTAILTYVARLAPEKRLLPRDPFDEAKCIATMTWLSSAVHPAYAHFKRPDRFVTVPSAQALVKERGKIMFWESLEQINGMFSDGNCWIMGSEYTVVDGYALVVYGWGVRAGLDMSSLLAFTEWKTRMLLRPAVRRILESEQNILATP